MRSIILIILTMFAINAKAVHADPSITNPVMLNTAFKVEKKIIRLGDLFTNTGKQSEVAVAYSPEPGKRISFDARWLYRIARAYRLDWRPMNDRVRSVVFRASRVISRDEIEDSVRVALAKEGVARDSDVELFDQFIRLHVPLGSLSGISVDGIEHNPRNSRFSAVISVSSNSQNARQYRIRGRIHKTSEIPVLIRRVLSGETINKNDIKWIKVRDQRIQQNAVRTAAEIVGMTPKRSIRPGAPILLSSIQVPIMVAKGSLVTMFLQAPQMVLTARGKALENGSDGDVIPIRNMNSKKIVEAEIIGHGKVAVRPVAKLAMN